MATGSSPTAFCPGITIGACHKVTGTISDHGTFTTQVGNAAPGDGSLNGGSVPNIGVAVTGPMSGSLSYTFYVNKPLTSKASVSNAPSSVSGDTPSTGQWPEQFFTPGNGIDAVYTGRERAGAPVGGTGGTPRGRSPAPDAPPCGF